MPAVITDFKKVLTEKKITTWCHWHKWWTKESEKQKQKQSLLNNKR
jgi:ribosomal protein S21